MKPSVQEAYAGLAKATGDELLKVDQPSHLPSALAEYMQVLQTPKPEPVQVAGEGANYRILPGEKAEFVPGSYSITLPDIPGLDPLKRTIKNVQIKWGETTALNVHIQQGQSAIHFNEQ
jgi:hypothetical protein